MPAAADRQLKLREKDKVEGERGREDGGRRGRRRADEEAGGQRGAHCRRRARREHRGAQAAKVGEADEGVFIAHGAEATDVRDVGGQLPE